MPRRQTLLNALTEITAARHFSASNPLVVDVFGLTGAVVLLLGVLAYYRIRMVRGPQHPM